MSDQVPYAALYMSTLPIVAAVTPHHLATILNPFIALCTSIILHILFVNFELYGLSTCLGFKAIDAEEFLSIKRGQSEINYWSIVAFNDNTISINFILTDL